MRNAGAVLEKPKIRKQSDETCRHHWIIEPALGPTSEGICRLCGATRTFLNIVEDTESKEDLNRFFNKLEEDVDTDTEEEDINTVKLET